MELLEREELKYILPLKRDNAIIYYDLLDTNEFKEEAWKVKEEKDYLHRIETHPETHNLSDYHKKRNTFGTLALLTNFERKPSENVYEMYKSRMTIEVLFDGMNNVLEADHSYMQNEQNLNGWMFINHITLQ